MAENTHRPNCDTHADDGKYINCRQYRHMVCNSNVHCRQFIDGRQYILNVCEYKRERMGMHGWLEIQHESCELNMQMAGAT